MIKECAQCKGEFNSRLSSRKYCSCKCANLGKITKEDKICGTCYNFFRPLKNSQKFCSRDCLYSRYKENAERTCVICDKTYIRKKKTQKYCSPECRRIGEYLKKHRHNEDDVITEKKCSICNQWKSIEEYGKDSRSKSRYIAKCKSCVYIVHIKMKYGLSEEDYNKLPKQCEICGDNVKLCVDHCHSTDNVRGILCDRCNVSLGGFKNSIEILRNAIRYLEEKS